MTGADHCYTFFTPDEDAANKVSASKLPASVTPVFCINVCDAWIIIYPLKIRYCEEKLLRSLPVFFLLPVSAWEEFFQPMHMT